MVEKRGERERKMLEAIDLFICAYPIGENLEVVSVSSIG
jgi:hypothetical protein